MKPIELTINYEPVAKGRPKFAMKNGMARSYTPTKTQEAQENIQVLLREKMASIPAHIPLKLTAVFYRTKPRWPPTSREKLPMRKPDLDNFLKLLVDALSMRKLRRDGNVISLEPVLPDDAQITALIASKRWAHNRRGKIVLRLEEDNSNVDY